MKNAWIAALSLIRLGLLRLRRGGGVRFSPVQDIAPSARVIVEKGGKLRLGEKVHMNPRAVLHVMPGGELTLGAHSYIGEGSLLVCKQRVVVGEGASLAPGVYVYDHDHVIKPGQGFLPTEYTTAPVLIGARTWIGAGCVLLKGTELGDRCVVGAGCVLHGAYPSDTKVIQKRETSLYAIQ